MFVILFMKDLSRAKSSLATGGDSNGMVKGLAPPPKLCERARAHRIMDVSSVSKKPEATRYLSGQVALELIGFTISTVEKRRVVRNNRDEEDAENEVYNLQTNFPPSLRHEAAVKSSARNRR